MFKIVKVFFSQWHIGSLNGTSSNTKFLQLTYHLPLSIDITQAAPSIHPTLSHLNMHLGYQIPQYLKKCNSNDGISGFMIENVYD